eukprot:70110_1
MTAKECTLDEVMADVNEEIFTCDKQCVCLNASNNHLVYALYISLDCTLDDFAQDKRSLWRRKIISSNRSNSGCNCLLSQQTNCKNAVFVGVAIKKAMQN